MQRPSRMALARHTVFGRAPVSTRNLLTCRFMNFGFMNFSLAGTSKDFLRTVSDLIAARSVLRIPAIIVILTCAGGLQSALAQAGSTLDLDHLRGQVVYLDFWASWCVPCRESFPWMKQMQQVYAREGLTVVAVNLDHDRADAERFLQRYPPAFSVQFDPQGALAEQYQVAGMPTSVLIDRHGVTRFQHIGFRLADRGSYEREVRLLLAEK